MRCCCLKLFKFVKLISCVEVYKLQVYIKHVYSLLHGKLMPRKGKDNSDNIHINSCKHKEKLESFSIK